MKAIRVAAFGAPEVLKLETNVTIPSFQQNQVLIKVEAAGINPVDTYLRAGTYSVLPSLPYTPGSDCAGIVAQVGVGVTKYKPGDRVFTVRNVSGSYAEYSTADQFYTHPLHSNISFEQGATLGVPYFTAHRSIIIRAKAKPGSSVLIHGASGAVGLAATQMAKAYNMTVIGTAGTEEGLNLVKSNGADHVFNHRSKNYLEEISKVSADDGGVDVILEMLANVNLHNDLTLLRRRGRVVIIGSRGPITIDPRLTMAKETSIMGVAMATASREEWEETAAAIQDGMEKGWIKPVVGKTYSLDEAAQAHRDIIYPGQNKGAMGNIIFKL